MNQTISTVLDNLTAIFTATDEALNEWSGEGCLQFPVLLGAVAVKMSWDEKQVREGDPLVRYFVRNNPAWHVTRGAHGGIMRVSDLQKKQAEKETLQAKKAAARAATEAKLGLTPTNS